MEKDKNGNFIGMESGLAIISKYWFQGEFWIAVWINDSIHKLFKDPIALHREIVGLIDIGYKIKWY